MPTDRDLLYEFAFAQIVPDPGLIAAYLRSNPDRAQEILELAIILVLDHAEEVITYALQAATTFSRADPDHHRHFPREVGRDALLHTLHLANTVTRRFLGDRGVEPPPPPAAAPSPAVAAAMERFRASLAARRGEKSRSILVPNPRQSHPSLG